MTATSTGESAMFLHISTWGWAAAATVACLVAAALNWRSYRKAHRPWGRRVFLVAAIGFVAATIVELSIALLG
jgi:hypothetical protein